MGERARRRHGLGEAAVAVVGPICPFVPIVLEGDEWTGLRTVRGGQPSVRHRVDDTCGGRPYVRDVLGPVLQAFDTLV